VASLLLIDGALVPGRAGTFTTLNPATEQPLGEAADAAPADMDAAIAAAKKAFDDTDWSRDVNLRLRCLRQFKDALNAEIETLRTITVSEVGAPISGTYGPHLQGPVDDLGFAVDTASAYRWAQDLGDAAPMGVRTRRSIVREPFGVVAAITPWNFPHQLNLAKLGAALAGGKHRRTQTGSGDTVVRCRSGADPLGAHGLSSRCRQRRHVGRPPPWRSTRG
jgi:aldehyde dehydrogenase (NAD+)